jgi:L-seryl-tRNA(Ser) seleniumtransferase
MRANPLCRAFRVDKGTLAALEATLRLYRDPDAVRRRLPVLTMLSTPVERLEERARALAGRLEEAAPGTGATLEARACPGDGRVGGGTYPEHRLPGWTVRLRHRGMAAGELARRLRHAYPPVVGRVEEGEVVLDVRTLLPGDDDRVEAALRVALEVEHRDASPAEEEGR